MVSVNESDEESTSYFSNSSSDSDNDSNAGDESSSHLDRNSVSNYVKQLKIVINLSKLSNYFLSSVCMCV